MYPDWESNWSPFAFWDNTQPAEPHQSIPDNKYFRPHKPHGLCEATQLCYSMKAAKFPGQYVKNGHLINDL